jgi:hypothetical protein
MKNHALFSVIAITRSWPSARVFYAVDPGPNQRASWTMMLGKPKWVVLTYDEQAGIGRVEDVGPS